LTYYAWNYVLAPLMPRKTREKVLILSSNWRNEILDHVDASSLPAHWGGTLVDEDGDPMCRSKVVVPEKVPSELHWAKSSQLRYVEHFATTSVPSGRVASIIFDAEAQSLVEWIVFSESAYTFFIQLLTGESGEELQLGRFSVGHSKRMEVSTETVFPELEIAGNKWLPEEESFRCEKAGRYRLCFRSDGWFGKVSIRCAVRLNGTSLT